MGPYTFDVFSEQVRELEAYIAKHQDGWTDSHKKMASLKILNMHHDFVGRELAAARNSGVEDVDLKPWKIRGLNTENLSYGRVVTVELERRNARATFVYTHERWEGIEGAHEALCAAFQNDDNVYVEGKNLRLPSGTWEATRSEVIEESL